MKKLLLILFLIGCKTTNPPKGIQFTKMQGYSGRTVFIIDTINHFVLYDTLQKSDSGKISYWY